MRLKQIKEFLNSLTDDQLEQPALLFDEDDCAIELGASEIGEDHYVDTLDEDNFCFSLSETKKPATELKKVYDKTFPIFYRDIYEG